MEVYEYRGEITSPVKFEYFPIDGEKNLSALEIVREAIAPFSLWEKCLEEYMKDDEQIEAYGNRIVTKTIKVE